MLRLCPMPLLMSSALFVVVLYWLHLTKREVRVTRCLLWKPPFLFPAAQCTSSACLLAPELSSAHAFANRASTKSSRSGTWTSSTTTSLTHQNVLKSWRLLQKQSDDPHGESCSLPEAGYNQKCALCSLYRSLLFGYCLLLAVKPNFTITKAVELSDFSELLFLFRVISNFCYTFQ